MNKFVDIQPRCSGKTKKCVELFLDDPYKSLLIVESSVERNYIIRKYGLDKFQKYIIQSYVDFDKICDKSIETLIIDDYLRYNLSHICNINDFIEGSNVDTVFIHTSVYTQFDTDIFRLAQRCKNRDYGSTISYSNSEKVKLFNNELSEIMSEESWQEYMYLLANILTDDDTMIEVSNYKHFGSEFSEKCLKNEPNLSKIKFEMAYESKYLHKYKYIKQIIGKKFETELSEKRKINEKNYI